MVSPKVLRRQKVRYRIRKGVFGTSQKLRLSVFRSNSDIYAQLIDDEKGVTVVASSSKAKNLKDIKGTKSEKAKKVGEDLAQKAIALGLKKCTFDRGGYLYHGRIKALAEGARQGGLEF